MFLRGSSDGATHILTFGGVLPTACRSAALARDQVASTIKECVCDTRQDLFIIISSESTSIVRTPYFEDLDGSQFFLRTFINTWTQGQDVVSVMGKRMKHLKDYMFLFLLTGQLQVFEYIFRLQHRGFQNRMTLVFTQGISRHMISNVVIFLCVGFEIFMATFCGIMIPLAGSKTARIGSKIVLRSRTLATDLAALVYCRAWVEIVLYLNHTGASYLISLWRWALWSAPRYAVWSTV